MAERGDQESHDMVPVGKGQLVRLSQDLVRRGLGLVRRAEGKKTVLVSDWNLPHLGPLVEKFFEPRGHRVISATNLEDALSLCMEFCPVAVLGQPATIFLHTNQLLRCMTGLRSRPWLVIWSAFPRKLFEKTGGVPYDQSKIVWLDLPFEIDSLYEKLETMLD